MSKEEAYNNGYKDGYNAAFDNLQHANAVTFSQSALLNHDKEVKEKVIEKAWNWIKDKVELSYTDYDSYIKAMEE